MKSKVPTILEKITLLNEAVLGSMAQADDKAIVKSFTQAGIKILGADFGFAWWKFSDKEEYKLAYKSSSTPYNPFLPRKNGGHATALRTKKPFFDTNVKKENYGLSDISPYMKSYVIVPISHAKYLYGGLTLCYKKQHNFTKEELTLAEAIGSTAAQAITIHRLNKKEKDRYKKEMLLKEAQVLLQQERLKIEFIANATHELRTPVAIIKGNVDLVLQTKDRTKDHISVLRAIDIEIKHLSGILSDLSLITSKIEETKNTVVYSTVNMQTLVKTVADRFSVLAKKKNISITVGSSSAVSVLGDEIYLERLFANLVKNSIVYGKKNGHINIVVKKTNGQAIIAVTDDGIGISKEDLAYVFERFYRADKSHSSDDQSTGLGLAIVKWIVEAHKGSIEVKRIPTGGTVFTVHLPL